MTTLHVGAASADLTHLEPNTEMMGWAQPANRARDVAMPLRCRAFWLRDPQTGRSVALATVELAFVDEAVRREVVRRLRTDHPDLGLQDADLLLSATHTHSGPGGFSHYFLYTLTTPGFRPAVFERIVQGIVQALVDAGRSTVPGTVRYAMLPMPWDEPVAWNRSVDAYNRNPGVARVDASTAHRATPREMPVLVFEAEDGRLLGTWAVFGVHNTSIHSDNEWLHADNKGYAARYVEDALTREGVEPVCAFAQGCAGDVTPNFRWDAKRGRAIGRWDDDHRNARLIGSIQAEHALRVREAARGAEALAPSLDADAIWVDMETAVASPEFASGRTGARTSYARLGVAFMEGTAEGPGPLLPLHKVNRRMSAWMARNRARRAARGDADAAALFATHGPMVVFIEAGRGRMGKAFGRFSMGEPVVPGWLDPAVAQVRRLGEEGRLDDRPWLPSRVQLQIVRIGHLALVAVPAEPTTMSGHRIREGLRERLGRLGVTEIAVVGYANGYAGYLTTFAEYQEQAYEGASSYHGQWTLAVYRSAYARIAERLASPAAERSDEGAGPPPPLSADELAMRTRHDVLALRGLR